MKIIRFLFVAIATLLCSVSVNAENIEFADAKVKELCVVNWDTNGDGELSKEEAAAVRDLGEVFTAHGDITSFNELQYFTGLTSIGHSAFGGCYYLTSITIPNGVTSIDDFAFFQCSDLTSIVIPDGVISIGNYALAACSGLISVIIGDGVISIGQSAFGSCSMTSITIPNSVTSIGYAAFSNCTGLTSINVDKDNRIYDSREDCNAIIETATNTLCSGCINTVIPNSVTCIGGNAFFRCSGLTSITIPNSVTSIGNSAFLGCTGLTSITIPISVTNIDNSAFAHCNNLTFVTVESKTPITLSSEDTFHDPARITLNVPTSYKVAYEAADVWKSFKEIVEYDKNIEFADAKVKELCVVNWDTNVDGEISLAEAAAVTDIGTIFKGKNITSFDELIYFTGLTSISEEAFQANRTLISLTIPNGVKSIGDYAFYYCTSLTSITIPNSVTSIGFSAFSGCSSLISVSIPNSVTSIGTSAFMLCSGLTSVTIGNSVTSIAKNTFANCYSLASVTIPNSVTSIGNGAFYSCESLTSVTIPNSVTSIGEVAFCGCESLTSVTIPNSVTSIGNRAFFGCSSLTSVTIPNSVTSIGESAFYCNNLISVTVESDIPINLASGDIFYNRANATLNVPPGCKLEYEAADVWKEFKEIVEYAVVENITFADAKVKELCVANWDTNVDGELSTAEAAAVSDLGEVFKQNEDITSFNELQYFTGLKSIGNYAFQYCTGLTTINIPNSVTSIGSSAFNGCSSLTSIVIPVGVTCIESMSFWQCVNMTSITLPNTLKKIGNSAFNGCSSLTSIVIPNSVEEISEWAFENCPNLTSVTVENENPISLTATYWTFSNRTNAILYVPKGCKEAYKAAGEWNEFKDIIEYDSWGNICFNDSKVKELCIANWDTNADGELSFEEAEAVSDIGSVFKDNDEIKSFNELQRFTSLTNINNVRIQQASANLQQVIEELLNWS